MKEELRLLNLIVMVIGSFLLDRFDENEDAFTFKHHYIAQTMDSQILYEVFDAIHKKQETEIITVSKSGEKIKQTVIPLRVFISVQSGRQYIMVYRRSKNRITSVRIDHIVKIRPLRTVYDHDELREKLDRMMPYIWGVSTQSRNSRFRRSRPPKHRIATSSGAIRQIKTFSM